MGFLKFQEVSENDLDRNDVWIQPKEVAAVEGNEDHTVVTIQTTGGKAYRVRQVIEKAKPDDPEPKSVLKQIEGGA